MKQGETCTETGLEIKPSDSLALLFGDACRVLLTVADDNPADSEATLALFAAIAGAYAKNSDKLGLPMPPSPWRHIAIICREPKSASAAFGDWLARNPKAFKHTFKNPDLSWSLRENSWSQPVTVSFGDGLGADLILCLSVDSAMASQFEPFQYVVIATMDDAPPPEGWQVWRLTERKGHGACDLLIGTETAIPLRIRNRVATRGKVRRRQDAIRHRDTFLHQLYVMRFAAMADAIHHDPINHVPVMGGFALSKLCERWRARAKRDAEAKAKEKGRPVKAVAVWPEGFGIRDLLHGNPAKWRRVKRTLPDDASIARQIARNKLARDSYVTLTDGRRARLRQLGRGRGRSTYIEIAPPAPSKKA